MIVIDRHHQARQWLTTRLSRGPVPRATLITEAAAAGLSRTTLTRAATQLGIISEPQPTWPRRTTWKLP